ncbi:MAG: hypothetical protein M3Q07_23590 [Pseudobdellovibrionaceae bacterium]|nr:hypothetical protein [Pseudobdellovibrionaceae bacterium]
MRPAQVRTVNIKKLSPEKRDSLQKTQRFLRNTFRKILTDSCDAEILEESLFVEDPHIYATWTSQSCLLGAGFKIGARIQFDSEDGRLLQTMQGKVPENAPDEQIIVRMQETTDLILANLQRYCQTAGLISGISQASLTKAFSKTQCPTYQLYGGAIDSWLLRVNDCVLYCTTHVIFDESQDLVVLAQQLPE